MISALWNGISGLNTFEKALDVQSNNVTNSNTIAHKVDTISFEDLMYQSRYGKGVDIQSVQKNFNQGSLQVTSNTLDVAIDGPGFFVVYDANDDRNYYTRAGNFQMGTDGTLQTAYGNKVYGSPTTFSNIVSTDGTQTYTSSYSQYIATEPIAGLDFYQTINAKSTDYTKTAQDTGISGQGYKSSSALINDIKALILVGIGMILFGFIPGFPTGILFVMGLLMAFVGYAIYMIEDNRDNAITRLLKPDSKKTDKPSISDDVGTLKDKKRKASVPDEKQVMENIMKLEVLELKLGIRLLQLVQGDSELLDKIRAIRKTIAAELGFVIPQIRIADDANLAPNEYQVYLKRISIAKGKVEINKLLAMGGVGKEKLKGLKVKEPVFNLEATWIDVDQKEDALMKGFTVVDAPTIISTHISEIIKKHSEDIITRQDIVDIIDGLKKDFPIVVEEAMKVTSYGSLLKVCRDLLHEKIPIVDMLTIVEAIADIAEFTKAPDILLEHVRSKLYRLITERFKDNDGTLHIITIKPDIEQQFIGKLQEQHGVSHLMLSIAEINNLVTKTKQMLEQVELKGFSKVAMVVDPLLRKRVSEIYEKFGLQVAVLSHAELDSKANFAIEGTIEF